MSHPEDEIVDAVLRDQDVTTYGHGAWIVCRTDLRALVRATVEACARECDEADVDESKSNFYDGSYNAGYNDGVGTCAARLRALTASEDGA